MSDRQNHHQELHQTILSFIRAHADGTRDDAELGELLERVAAFQEESIPAYARLSRRRRAGAIPAAVPTDVFRYTRLAVHPPSEDLRVFRTSGTTHGERGEHHLRDLSLYNEGALIQGERFLFPDLPDKSPDNKRLRGVILAPSPDELPDSSLSYMLGLFAEHFLKGAEFVFRDGALDHTRLRELIEGAGDDPIALLGTSFAFVFAEEAFQDAAHFKLAEGSRIMQTGGFKGRSRSYDKAKMHAILSARYGIPERAIIAEYGMTELSSQFYEPELRAALLGEPLPTASSPEARVLIPPPWVRAFPVHPETLERVPDGELGILRIDDLANLDTIACIQTSDLARATPEGVILHGRAEGAVPRGCSIAIEEILGGGE